MEKSKRPGIDNLKPFKKGEDPRRHITGEKKLPDIKKIIARVLSEEKDGVTMLEAMTRSVAVHTIRTGDIRKFEGLINRAFGKVKDVIEVSGTDGGPVQTETKTWVIEKTYKANQEEEKPTRRKRPNGK